MRLGKDAVLVALLIVIAAIALAVFYAETGPGWDLIAHYLNARSLSNPAFYGCLLNPVCNLYNQNPLFYFESYRAPLAGFFMALINIFADSAAAIAIYLATLFVAYVFAIRFLAKKINADSLTLFALLLSPYIIYVAFVAGSEEIVSLIFLLFALGFLAKRSPLFGLFIGLATLGKYPTLALVPMILLLYRPRKILYASILFVLVIAPWLAFGQVFFLNGALTSYVTSLAISQSNAGQFAVIPQAYLFVLGYPILFGLLGLAAVYPNRKKIAKAAGLLMKKAKSFERIYRDDTLYLYSILGAFFILSVIATLYIGPYYDAFTEARYGYLLGVSSALIVAAALNSARKYARFNLPIAVGALAVPLFVASIYLSPLVASTYGTSVYNGVYGNAVSELSSLGYGGCRILSNDWVYMLYYNVSAFSQFDLNSSSSQYPILLFKNQYALTAINKTGGILAQAKTVYNSTDFSVLLPANYKCYA